MNLLCFEPVVAKDSEGGGHLIVGVGVGVGLLLLLLLLIIIIIIISFSI